MNERFSDAARQSLVNANREAERRRHKYIGSLHILISSLNTNPEVLEPAYINVAQLRDMAIELVSTTPCAGAKSAIENALALAVQYNSRVVDVPHIVLGVLTEPDESVTQLFDRLNLDIVAVRTHMLDQLS